MTVTRTCVTRWSTPPRAYAHDRHSGQCPGGAPISASGGIRNPEPIHGGMPAQITAGSVSTWTRSGRRRERLRSAPRRPRPRVSLTTKPITAPNASKPISATWKPYAAPRRAEHLTGNVLSPHDRRTIPEQRVGGIRATQDGGPGRTEQDWARRREVQDPEWGLCNLV